MDTNIVTLERETYDRLIGLQKDLIKDWFHRTTAYIMWIDFADSGLCSMQKRSDTVYIKNVEWVSQYFDKLSKEFAVTATKIEKDIQKQSDKLYKDALKDKERIKELEKSSKARIDAKEKSSLLEVDISEKNFSKRMKEKEKSFADLLDPISKNISGDPCEFYIGHTIKTIAEENARFKSMSLWQRIKYIFKK